MIATEYDVKNAHLRYSHSSVLKERSSNAEFD